MARTRPLHAYVAFSILTGVRTEEARALRWSHVVAWADDATGWQSVSQAGFDHGQFAVYVWRSVRADGETKTEKSRRTLEIPDEAVRALREHHKRQAAQRLRAGKAWEDSDLVHPDWQRVRFAVLLTIWPDMTRSRDERVTDQ